MRLLRCDDTSAMTLQWFGRSRWALKPPQQMRALPAEQRDGDGTRLPLSHARKDRSGTESLLWRLAGSLPPRFHTGPACRTFQACFTGFSTPLKFGRGGGKAQVRVRHACNPLPFALGLPATMCARCLGGIASRF